MDAPKRELATIGGGCFWCLEAVFVELKGVLKVESGYAGGSKPNPTYEEVCDERTGHAEVVQITFDPTEITYRDIVEVFFSVHDPTTLNRQGYDSGTSYRSVILHHNAAQDATAREVIKEVGQQGTWGKAPIVTELKALQAFYRAEDYHQSFYRKNPNLRYCVITIEPKLSKLRQYYLNKLKK